MQKPEALHITHITITLVNIFSLSLTPSSPLKNPDLASIDEMVTAISFLGPYVIDILGSTRKVVSL